VPYDPLTAGEPVVTPEDVAEVVPGVEAADVTEATILAAQVVVEIHAGAGPLGDPTTFDRMRSSDMRNIRLAVAYHAAWLSGQIDYASRTDVTVIEGDARAKPRDEQSLFLAPLAKMSIARLSWKRGRTRRNDTRVRRRAGLGLVCPPDVTVSHSVMDNPNQQYGFMNDSGEFWGAP
jgi:hypothetical protein